MNTGGGCCFSPILFNLRRGCLIKKTLEGVGDFKEEGNVILTVKYADDLVLLAVEDDLLQGIIAKVLWNGNKCEKKIKGNKNLEAVSLSGDCDRPKPEENKECFDFLFSMTTNDSSLTRDIKSSIAITKAAFNNRVPFTSKLDLNVRMKLIQCYFLSIALCGAEKWELWKVDRKYLERFEMWCWSRMEISWTDRVRNEEVLVEERNILHARNRKTTESFGPILLWNCLLKRVIEGKIEGRIEVTG